MLISDSGEHDRESLWGENSQVLPVWGEEGEGGREGEGRGHSRMCKSRCSNIYIYTV